MVLTETAQILLIGGSFVAALFNAVFGMGGALLMLGVSSSLLPISVVIPLHSTFMIGALYARCLHFWPYIRWRLVAPFMVGSAAGVYAGVNVFIDLSPALVAAVLGSLILVTVWVPVAPWPQRWPKPWEHSRNGSFVALGLLHSFVSTVFAFGGFLHSVIVRLGLNRMEITGTLAGSLVFLSTFKLIGFATHGFDYRPYLALIAWATVAGFVGTWIGKKMNRKISEGFFIGVFKFLMTLTAFKLFYDAAPF